MKPLTLLFPAILLFASCTVVVDKKTLPDGTVVETTSKSSDPAALAAAVKTAELLAPVLNDIVKKQGVNAQTVPVATK